MRMRCLWVALLGFCTPVAATPLHDAAVGERVSVPAFDYAAGKAFSGPLHLRRIEVYAADARILLPLPDGRMRELPRSQRRYFVADGERTASRLYLSVSPDGGDFEGALFNADGTYTFAGRIRDGQLLRDSGGKADDSTAPDFHCGTDHRVHAVPDEAGAGDRPVLPVAVRSKGATHAAVVAVDTDNELFTQKFGDTAQGLTNATNYLAALFTAMNVFYGRDLSVTLQQGTTFLRAPHASGTDPYVQSSTGNQLNEVGAIWRDTPSLVAVNRAFVAFISGKSPSANSTSGVAWVINSGSYCTRKGSSGSQVFGHYSVSQVFRFNGSTAANDVTLVGHEIGHNFGADHTHCADRTTGAGTVASNTIDQCFNAEAGCYAGAVSCPTDNSVSGRGSLMSYCHFGGGNGAGCGNSLNEFHPAHEQLLGARVATNIGNGCFTALNQGVGPNLAAASPASGSTTLMSGGATGAVVSRNITFSVSGGSGAATTALQCAVAGGSVSIASGASQTVGVGGSPAPVVARFTLGSSVQSGSIGCTATPQGGSPATFTYGFTAPAAAAVCTGSCIFRHGLEP